MSSEHRASGHTDEDKSTDQPGTLRPFTFQPHTSLPQELAERPGRWFIFDQDHKLLIVAGEIPTAQSWPSEALLDQHVLGTSEIESAGVSEQQPVWTARCSNNFACPADAQFIHLREAFAVLTEDDWMLAGRASQILSWAADHAWCGRCAKPTVAHPTDRAMRCSSCQLMAFPRLAPAVIVLVTRDDGRALLAWGRQFPGRFFSALAGFVEPGESLEQTVVREVREEVGIEVTDIRYFGSQPWPFPNSLMIGFTARYAGGMLQLQESEIVEADWYAPSDLPPVPQGRMSIAAWLIDDWLQNHASAPK